MLSMSLTSFLAVGAPYHLGEIRGGWALLDHGKNLTTLASRLSRKFPRDFRGLERRKPRRDGGA